MECIVPIDNHFTFVIHIILYQNCDLTNSDLRDANLRGANLTGANFSDIVAPLHMSQTVN